jgi:hypothetical protein
MDVELAGGVRGLAELCKNGLGGLGHVWEEDVGEEVEEVQGKAHDCGAPLWLFSYELVGELVVLKELVADSGDAECTLA